MLLLTPFNSKQWAYLNLYINRKFWRIGLFLQQKYYAIRKDLVKREIAINEIYWRCFRHSSILILLLHVCSTQLLKKKQDFLFLVCKHVFITNLSRKNGRHLKSTALSCNEQNLAHCHSFTKQPNLSVKAYSLPSKSNTSLPTKHLFNFLSLEQPLSKHTNKFFSLFLF